MHIIDLNILHPSDGGDLGFELVYNLFLKNMLCLDLILTGLIDCLDVFFFNKKSY